MKKIRKTKEDSVSMDKVEIEETTTKEESSEKEEAVIEAALFEADEKLSSNVEVEDGEAVSEKDKEMEKESSEEEISDEKGLLEETVAEEVVQEDAPTEETPIEVETTEEVPSEKKKIKINKKTIFIIIGAIFAVVLAVYLGFTLYFSERFLMNTIVNGVDCTGKTVKDVEKIMQTSVEEYVLTLEERHGITEEIKGVDIDIKYNNVPEIKKAMNKQNSFFWIKALFEENNIKADINFEYNSDKLDKVIEQLDCLKEDKQVSPVSATPIYQDGTFGIEEEVYGTVINREELCKAIHECVDKMEQSLDLMKKGCYIPPTYTKDSQEVLDARDALNKCLEAEITYSLDEIVVKVDKSQIANWVSVDENMNIIVDETLVRQFTDTLGSYYNTPNTALDLTTPTGKVVNIANARLGRVVGSAAECAELIEEIKRGDVITRAPLFSQGATPGGEPVWGSTYLEVDISAQHMWYIVDGAVAFESDVITGSPGRDTPTGIFSVLKMKRNKTLTGRIVPATGKPEYITPVDYWMRITWSGVGFHDATWQPGFGGQLYRQGYGSHGCINMPYNNVKALYGMVSVGCPVVIHY